MTTSYVFKATELGRRERAYTYDDVLLVPCRSSVASRFDVDLSASFTHKKKLKLPFVAANMDTVSEASMCKEMNNLGAVGILHRFMDISEQSQQIRQIAEARDAQASGVVAGSIGIAQDAKERARSLVDNGAEVLTVDVAHGHTDAMMEMVAYLKKEFPGVEVLAGNVATAEGTLDLIKAGADAVKVGIGPGSMCTTRIITGVGMPQLSAVAVCSQVARPEGVAVIADGGIRQSGDIVKALCVGASTVMLGSMLAGTVETPGETRNAKKMYRGMASREAQVSWRGGDLPEGMAPEGESSWIPCKGPVRETISELAGGLRSGMSYLNSKQLDELLEFASFVEVSPHCVRENHAHALWE